MKKVIILTVLFACLIWGQSFATMSLYDSATEQLKVGNYKKALELYMQGCKNNDVSSCGMIAVSMFYVNPEKSIDIAKTWINYLLANPDPKVKAYGRMIDLIYINFYRENGVDVSWFTNKLGE